MFRAGAVADDLGRPFSSSELSSSSVDSPSCMPWRRGIPRTGRMVFCPGSSSSLESANRLRKVLCGPSSSSPSESSNRDGEENNVPGARESFFPLGDLPVEKNEVFPLLFGPVPRSVVGILVTIDPAEIGRGSSGLGENCTLGGS
jgi:hypothetical protein